jgi:hypothetical protein
MPGLQVKSIAMPSCIAMFSYMYIFDEVQLRLPQPIDICGMPSVLWCQWPACA